MRVSELSEALGEVKQLRGLLSICAYCKRIREGEHFTRSVAAYLTEHTDATFRYAVCPECYCQHVLLQVVHLLWPAPDPGPPTHTRQPHALAAAMMSNTGRRVIRLV